MTRLSDTLAASKNLRQGRRQEPTDNLLGDHEHGIFRKFLGGDADISSITPNDQPLLYHNLILRYYNLLALPSSNFTYGLPWLNFDIRLRETNIVSSQSLHIWLGLQFLAHQLEVSYYTTQVNRKYCGQGNLRSLRNRPTAIDIFAGCGGATLGFKNAGFEVRAAVEIDSIACSTYRMNHPEVNLLECDIRRLTVDKILSAANLEPGQTTVLLGCPPCQGFSRQSKSGMYDDRNSLVWRFALLAIEIAPEFIAFENVPGLSNGVGKFRWARAKRLLQRAGYRLTEDVVDSASYGVPQFRKRLLMLARRDDSLRLSIPEATHCNPVNCYKNGLAPWATVRNALKDLPMASSYEASGTDRLHQAPRHKEIVLRRLRHIPHDGGGRRSLPDSLVLQCHKSHSGHWDVYGRMWWDKPAPTLTTGCTNVTRGRFAHPDEDRAITLREAARLQTFPNWYRFSGARSEIASQIGNAVPPLLAEVVARHILSIKAATCVPHNG